MTQQEENPRFKRDHEQARVVDFLWEIEAIEPGLIHEAHFAFLKSVTDQLNAVGFISKKQCSILNEIYQKYEGKTYDKR